MGIYNIMGGTNMQKYMRVCPICVKENNSIGENDVAGWIDWFKSEEILSNDETCLWGHDVILEKKLMTCEEFNILNKISKEPSFMQAMEDLKEKDIIEYNLKMSQFKSQVGQQTQEENKVHCPKCNSTNIQIVSRKWSLLTGFATNKTDRVCVACKHKW